jgi:hypothetical protein
LLAFVLSFAVAQIRAEDPVNAVELYEAVEAGQVSIKFIPASAVKANVLIENMTDRVMHIELPDAIAAVPVLAQLGLGQNAGQNGGGAQTQGVGGGLNAGNGMQPGRGFGNGFGNAAGNNPQRGQADGFGMGLMRLAPQQTRKLTATTVCLEQGKPEPHPRIAYQMIPIEGFTSDAGVIELCRRLGRGEVEPQAAQAAAWHLANELTWEQLAQLNRIESRYLGNVRFFTPSELARAKEVVESLSQPPTDSVVSDDAPVGEVVSSR